MGLDIAAFACVEFVQADDSEDLTDDLLEMYRFLSPNPDFPGRADPVVEGVYRITGEVWGFSCGTYSSYTGFRSWITENLYGVRYLPLTLGNRIPTGPFYDLLEFSDCEGILGGPVCTKLLQDFRNYTLASSTMWIPQEDRFHLLYQNFTRALEIASPTGCLLFH